MADPVAAALATISTHGFSVDDEAPKKLKILFGVIMGAIAYVLVASGGVGSVKGMWVIIGFPIALSWQLSLFLRSEMRERASKKRTIC